jgi:hypothetical protein
MRGWRPQRVGARVTTAAAAVLVLLVILGGLAVFGFSSMSMSSGSFGDDAVTRTAYRSIKLGSSRDKIEERIGQGQDAIEFRESGVALEPIDADCIYYPQAGTGNYRDIIQLCFRNNQLVRKQTYRATPGSPLG